MTGSTSSAPEAPSAAVSTTIVPMRSRQKLLGFFAFIFAFWIVMMVVMYVATVYPRRHPHGSTVPSVSPLEGAPAGTVDAPVGK